MAKKTNRQDSTLRNVRAANKRIADLERRVSALEQRLGPQEAPSEPLGPRSSRRGSR
jgi:tetrahydromethanopterin S-methyltransferase subunit B